jgi:hypothetical protein
MGRAWQFFLMVAMTCAVMGYLYYSSDYYGQRSTAPAGSAAESTAPTSPTGK